MQFIISPSTGVQVCHVDKKKQLRMFCTKFDCSGSSGTGRFLKFYFNGTFLLSPLREKSMVIYLNKNYFFSSKNAFWSEFRALFLKLN